MPSPSKFHLTFMFSFLFFSFTSSSVSFFLPQIHPPRELHPQLHHRLQSDSDCVGVSCRFLVFSVQSVLVGGCVGRLGRIRIRSRIHMHCYLHHLWSAATWQWVVVLVVMVVVSVSEVLEVLEAVEIWVWGWHRSGCGSGYGSGSPRHMNVHFGVLRLSDPLAPSVAHSNLSRDHDIPAHPAHTAEADSIRTLDSCHDVDDDDGGKSYPYHSGNQQCGSADCGQCSSRDTGSRVCWVRQDWVEREQKAEQQSES